MTADFYDIESLSNVFTLTSYIPGKSHDGGGSRINVYVLDDDDLWGLAETPVGRVERNMVTGEERIRIDRQHSTFAMMLARPYQMQGSPMSERYVQLVETIRRNNPVLTHQGRRMPEVYVYDLHSPVGVKQLFSEFLVTASTPELNRMLRIQYHALMADGTVKPLRYEPDAIVRDTDPKFAENPDDYPILMGYNSYNYDSTVLAYLASLFAQFGLHENSEEEITARKVRTLNDFMFHSEIKRSMPSALRYTEHFDKVLDLLENGMSVASLPRQYSNWNALANDIRNSMMRTGRHVDVARLNEKQQRVGLKRLLGMLGYQIFESDRLKGDKTELETFEDLADLIAYNVSDVVYLERLFQDPHYSSQFDLKRNMLKTYPELVYDTVKEADGKTVAVPLAVTTTVRRNRLFSDSSSQQLASRTLSPEGTLHDKDFVEPMYPHPTMAAEHGIEPFDVLEMARDFFYQRVLSRMSDPVAYAEAKAHFDHIYACYDAIRGKNFNEGADYVNNDRHQKSYAPDDMPTTLDTYMLSDEFQVHSLKQVASGLPYCIPYYDGNGRKTSCFAVMSTGGVHGAEANIVRYMNETAAWRVQQDVIDFAKAHFGQDEDGALALRLSVKRLKDPVMILDADGNEMPFPDGQEHFVSEFLASGSTRKKARWRTLRHHELFVTDPKTGANKLNPRYTWTSAASVNHDDFSSYYPSLLRMMNAFFSEVLKYDRYGEIYLDKERFGKMMKDMSRPKEERDRLSLDRNGVKLILNSASGAGDAKFDNPIRMNNNIIAMRIIGQLFTWMIGQAMALEGAGVISTNTDGLYTVLDGPVNDRILEDEGKRIAVLIEPERMNLISKDSNNRVEFEYRDTDDESAAVVCGFDDEDRPVHLASGDAERPYRTIRVLAASGGTLSCRRGPDVSKSLAHPALIDWALAEYLMRTFARSGDRQESMAEPYDERLGRQIILEASQDPDRVHGLLMFQNVIASSPNSHTYIFAQDMTPEELDMYEAEHDGRDDDPSLRSLQHYNRVFVMKDGTEGTTHLYTAAGRLVTPATRAKRARTGEQYTRTLSNAAARIMRDNSDDPEALKNENRDIVRKKVTGIEPEWSMLIENSDLRCMPPERVEWIYANLDLDKYERMLRAAFEDNWQNKLT